MVCIALPHKHPTMRPHGVVVDQVTNANEFARKHHAGRMCHVTVEGRAETAPPKAAPSSFACMHAPI